MGWKVDEPTVELLENLEKRLQSLPESIKKETENLKAVYEENKAGLGYHSAEIGELIEEIESIEGAGTQKVLVLTYLIGIAKQNRKEVIERKYKVKTK